MKTVLCTVLFSFLGIGVAQADMKPEGTYIVDQCGTVTAKDNPGINPLTEICVGHKQSLEGTYVSFNRLVGVTVPLLVVNKTELPSGQADWQVQGEDGEELHVYVVEGQGPISSMTVHLDGVVEVAGGFQYLMHTM